MATILSWILGACKRLYIEANQQILPLRFGAMFNMAKLVMDDFRSGFEKGPWWQRLFNGYNLTTWMVVLNLGSTGLLVSWLMKYADNIVKVSITSIIISWLLLSVYAVMRGLFSFEGEKKDVWSSWVNTCLGSVLLKSQTRKLMWNHFISQLTWFLELKILGVFSYQQVYSTSMAMLLTTLLSGFLFNFKPTVQVILDPFLLPVQLFFSMHNIILWFSSNVVPPHLSLRHQAIVHNISLMFSSSCLSILPNNCDDWVFTLWDLLA